MLRIEKATIADCELIHRLAWEVFPHTYRAILSPEQINYMMEWMYSLSSLHKQIEEEGHVYLLAYTESNEAIGYISVQLQEANLFHLQKIYVLPQHQGKHYGSFLFHQAINYIKQVHPTPCRIELNVNRQNPALQFYKHMGMHQSSEGDFPIGNGYYMNDYIMAMDI